MQVIHARNVNHALPRATMLFRNIYMVERIAPRGRATLEVREPVSTVYANPRERVLFSPARDANPFFHFFEALWIMAGQNDVEWLSFFLPRIVDYSDDGQVFHGGYGARMRRAVRVRAGGWYESTDQFQDVLAELRRDRNSRRAVMGLWAPEQDSGYQGKDMPCNCTVMFKLRRGALNMLVANRSNDMIWGAYGANVVQFSTIQEVMASMLDASVGKYTQVSDSFHVYEDEPSWQRVRDAYRDIYNGFEHDPYTDRRVAADFAGREYTVEPYPLVSDPASWFAELKTFMIRTAQAIGMPSADQPEYIEDAADGKNPFFNMVGIPLFNAFAAYKRRDFDLAMRWALMCAARDWSLAAGMWLYRRAHKEESNA